jgi:hypothetical protein
MNAPPFPPNPSFGQFFGNWVWSGSRWVCTNTNGIRVVTQVFTASAPYTPSPGLVSLVVETVGGGGGGGDVAAVTGISGGGGGGGSGGYSRITLASGLVLGGVNVTIGAGGAPQTTGGTTSFGAFCVANGGMGGEGFAGGSIDPDTGNPTWGQPGWGAGPGVGDIAMSGNAGTPGQNFYFGAGATDTIAIIYGGMGGASVFGGSAPPPGAGPGVVIIGQPTGGLAPGAGGVGNVANQSNLDVPQPGASGAAGICIVTEYCWADAVDDGGCCGSGGARVAYPTGWQGGFDND